MTQRDSVNIIGIDVDDAAMPEVIETVMKWTDSGMDPNVAFGVNANVCNMYVADESFRALVDRCQLRYADGQSVVWASRILGSPLRERVATTDLIQPLAAACASRFKKLYLYGGAPGIAEKAADNLRVSYHGLLVRTHHGYLDTDHEFPIIEDINQFGTDVLMVGLGDPLQLEWIERYRAELSVGAVLTCGGLFDWTSGRNPRAPRIMVRLGLEWLWRLWLEPRRLARRYVIGNPLFILRLAKQRFYRA